MMDLLADFSLPWGLWVFFGIFIGGILFSTAFRHEFDAMIAHLLGLKKKGK